MTMVQVAVAENPLESTTLTWNVYVPAVVGVPDITPVPLFSVSPGGSDPEIREKV